MFVPGGPLHYANLARTGRGGSDVATSQVQYRCAHTQPGVLAGSIGLNGLTPRARTFGQAHSSRERLVSPNGDGGPTATAPMARFLGTDENGGIQLPNATSGVFAAHDRDERPVRYARTLSNGLGSCKVRDKL
jgi:hypothetical protein